MNFVIKTHKQPRQKQVADLSHVEMPKETML